jgi:uncharacterized protein (TIGR02453 family)
MFSGFTSEAQSFLRELKANNNRDWFAENKSRYESAIMEPALAFVAAVERPLKRVSPHFTAIAKRSGGSIMRVYRDIRFSKDKSPYKPYVGIHFRHELGKDAHAPGFYFHIDTDEVFLGGGIWQPEQPLLAQIRFLIDDEPGRWTRILKSKPLTQRFELSGESLKRPPKGYDESHPLIEHLKRKDHFVISHLSTKEFTSPKLVETVIERFKIAKPYLQFLCDAIKVPC